MLIDWEQVRAGDGRAKTPGCFVATGSRDKSIRIWDALTGQCLRVLVRAACVCCQAPPAHYPITTQNGHDNWVRALVFHPSGKFLLSASDDKTIRIWDLQTGRLLKTLQDAHDHFITTMAWGRATVGGGAGTEANGHGPANGLTNGEAANVKRVVNVLATASVDMSIRVSRAGRGHGLKLTSKRVLFADLDTVIRNESPVS